MSDTTTHTTPPSPHISVVHKIDLSHVACPACGRSDRWDGIFTKETEHNNPELVVFCDCGRGEIVVVIE